MSTHPTADDLAILTALSARYSLADLRAAAANEIPLTVYYRPSLDKSQRRRWHGIPDAVQLERLRLIYAAAVGRQPAEAMRTACDTVDRPPDSRSPVGTLYQGFERIQTYKWTTPTDTKKPLPPNSFAWRDTYTGEIFLLNPFDRHETKTA